MTVWKQVRFLETPEETFEYEFELPVPLADWDVFACWERERFHSMREHLQRGDILFDVGTEHGWCNLLYADMVGPANMVLIEPTREFWPNIKATWERNYATGPKACYQGLVGAATTDENPRFTVWPAAADGALIDRKRYEYLHKHSDGIQQIRLDDIVEQSGIVPAALTIDVEGAEYSVIAGAADTLARHHPLVWISIHPDLMRRDYHATPADLVTFMESLNYTGTLLATDHEQHWMFA